MCEKHFDLGLTKEQVFYLTVVLASDRDTIIKSLHLPESENPSSYWSEQVELNKVLTKRVGDLAGLIDRAEAENFETSCKKQFNLSLTEGQLQYLLGALDNDGRVIDGRIYKHKLTSATHPYWFEQRTRNREVFDRVANVLETLSRKDQD